MKLRIGIVGLGDHWESRHLPAMQALSDRYEVRAVCDPVWHRAERAAQQIGARPVGGFRALTERNDVDAVFLLSPQFYGWLPIHAACEQGKALYCAAGFDLSQEAMRSITSRVQESGIAFMAEFRCRHAASTLRLKELMATRLGAPRFIFAERREPVSPASSPDRHPLDQVVERIDWCRFVVGRDPESVLGVSRQEEEAGHRWSYSHIHLDFPAADEAPGVLAQIRHGRYLPPQWKEAASFRAPADFQVICQRGVAFADLSNRITWFDEAGQHTETLEGERPVDHKLLLAFHRAVTSLLLNASNLDDMNRAVAIALRGEESARLGQQLRLQFDR